MLIFGSHGEKVHILNFTDALYEEMAKHFMLLYFTFKLQGLIFSLKMVYRCYLVDFRDH